MNITPAAIAAFAKGDMDNFVVASTPGGIEAQEAAGQAALVGAANKLPKDLGYGGVTREQIAAAWGVVFGTDADDIFVNVTLPAGWSIKATDHSMHSDLLDSSGSRRAGIFYKAAFYDRSAHLSLNRRFVVDCDYAEPTQTYIVKDSKTGTTLHVAGTAGYRDWSAQDAASNAADNWLMAKYPDFKNPLAYWDEA
jgi:hypothetical protein